MAVSNSNSIVTEGLKFYWDPANGKSYPGSGSAVYNLSNQGDGLTDGSGSLGEFLFTTSSISGSTPVWKAKPSGLATGSIYYERNRLNLSIPHSTRLNNIMTQVSSGWTIEEWILIAAIPYPNTPAGYVFSNQAYSNGSTGFDLNHGNGMGVAGMKPGASNNSGGSYEYTVTYAVSTELSALNKWQCRATIWDRDSDMFLGYINGTLQASGSMSAVSGEAIYDGGGAQLGTLYGWYHDGQRGPFKIYDRVLTSNELLQNFNATKSRYSLT